MIIKELKELLSKYEEHDTHEYMQLLASDTKDHSIQCFYYDLNPEDIKDSDIRIVIKKGMTIEATDRVLKCMLSWLHREPRLLTGTYRMAKLFPGNTSEQ